jgi:pimeloyl-ACP methyl ester carboxylesterase
MKIMIQILQLFSPKLVSRIAYKYLSNPRIRKLRDSEESILSKAHTEDIEYKKFKIYKYQWGKENKKTALLIHGWEGRAGNFAGIIDDLIQNKYQVVAYDAPAHGKSSIKKTSMFEFAEFLESEFTNIMPQVIISHSFGSVNAATIFRNNPEFNLDLWIMVTTPYNFMSRVNEISDYFGIKSKAKNELIKLIQNDTNEDINHLNMASYCQELSNVKKAIIVHSKTDKVLPIEGAREVTRAFKRSSLIELDNLGHYNILWSDELRKIITESLKQLLITKN